MKQVLYFSAKWCTACQATTPIVEQVKKSSQAQVAMIDVDYDDSNDVNNSIQLIKTALNKLS